MIFFGFLLHFYFVFICIYLSIFGVSVFSHLAFLFWTWRAFGKN